MRHQMTNDSADGLVADKIPSRGSDRSLRLKKLQTLSVTMLRAATTAMCLRNPNSQSSFVEMSGGYLGFSGPDVPLTRAVGIGTSRPVEPKDMIGIETFYKSRNSPVRIVISERTHPGVEALLKARGYQAGGYLDNWWRPLTAEPEMPSSDEIEVTRATHSEASVWVRTVAAGFQEQLLPLDETALAPRLLDTFYCLGFADGAHPFIAWRNGQPAGGGVIHIDSDVAHIRTTSCRLAHRCHGVQTALLAARLRTAFKAGCKLAFSSTEGAGSSARNLVRFRFKPLSVSFTMSSSN
jgi:hypothetical protein